MRSRSDNDGLGGVSRRTACTDWREFVLHMFRDRHELFRVSCLYTQKNAYAYGNITTLYFMFISKHSHAH